MPNGCPRNTMSAPATSLSLTPPLHSSLFRKPKHQKQQHTPHIVFQVQENTPHAQNAQSSAIFPGFGNLAVVADQSIEHVVGVTVLAAGHSNRRRCSGRRSSPPKQHQANVLRLQARLDPIKVRLKPIEPTHSAPPELRALSRPGDVDAGVLPPWANNHRLRRSLDLAASVSLLEEEYVEEEEDPAAGNDRLDEEFDAACDVADFQDGSN
uniref:Uncharacterized protein n=1 Tax=Oryza nivara TaxID=4536 RepID=A0A0E0HZY7_ORYNI